MECCGDSRNNIEYLKYENNDNNLSGPFINIHVNKFEDIEKEFENKSWIDEFLEKINSFKQRESLGYRKHLGYEEKDGKQLELFDNKYTWINYQTVLEMAENISKNLELYKLAQVKEFTGEGKFKFVGFFARNMVDYLIMDLACQLNNITTVTLYATLGEEAFKFICTQTELTTICVSPDINVNILIKYQEMFKLNNLKNVIIFDLSLPIITNGEERLKAAGFNVFKFSDLIKKIEEANNIELKKATSDSIYTICYTSGTTGIPKGAKILQRNMIAEMQVFENTDLKFDIETTLFYLPLAHIMERLNCLHSMIKGSKLGCISGDVRTTLADDIKVLQPTIFVAVPRVLNLFRDKINSKFAELTGFKKYIFEKGRNSKLQNLQNESKLTHWFYDTLIFNKVKDQFGGKIKYLLTGSAPITKETSDDLKIYLGAPMIEAYGMTECCGACISTKVKDTTNDSCGGVLRNCKVKLVDVPEMNYHSRTKLGDEESPTGEICVYGPIVFGGYFRNPQTTKETIIDGWLHTGDIGRILPGNKGIKIIDRKKEIFKLSQGEYIAPTKLESVYSNSKYVQQINIYGESKYDRIIAIIVPKKHNLLSWLQETQKNPDSNITHIDELIDKKDETILNEIRKDLAELHRINKFNSLEKVENIILSKDEFDRSMMTDTMKMKRKSIQEAFQKQIDEIYKK